jgi:hypothetical protein
VNIEFEIFSTFFFWTKFFFLAIREKNRLEKKMFLFLISFLSILCQPICCLADNVTPNIHIKTFSEVGVHSFLAPHEPVLVKLWGAGGGGAGRAVLQTSGGGGGGGAFASSFILPILGSSQVWRVFVGAGGPGGSVVGQNGGTGESSFISIGTRTGDDLLIVAGGGGGGQSSNQSLLAPGGETFVTNHPAFVQFVGFDGQVGSGSGQIDAGFGGGSPFGGQGGPPGGFLNDGIDGVVPGGGGGGGAANLNGTTTIGGDGAQGFVTIQW